MSEPKAVTRLVERVETKKGLLHPGVAALGRVYVSRMFRDTALNWFPILRKRSDYWTLFCYLLFGSWLDEDTQRPLLCAAILSAIEGRDPRNSEAEKFLIKFHNEVLYPVGTIQWTGWNKPANKCRQLRKRDFGGAFEEILRREYLGQWNDTGLVYLVDGSLFNEANFRRIRREQKEAAGQLPTFCKEAETIRSYMNNLSSNLFTKALRQNFHCALKASFNLPETPVKDAQLRILRHISGQPQPFYFPSAEGHTVRLSTSEAIPNLKSNVRRALTRGWEEADLRSSQFAICSTLWNVPELLTFLKSGKSLWNHLLDYLKISQDERERAKPVLKRILYATCFGMGRPTLRNRSAYWLVVAGLNKKLFQHLQQEPLIAALLEARDAALQTIALTGGAENCYGEWKRVTEERQPRDIMAEIAQAWEMKLIYPAFALARETSDFTITIFQYDGFSVHFSRRSDEWRKKIDESINENAKQLGFLTNLEWS
jgi:hypothetical protein